MYYMGISMLSSLLMLIYLYRWNKHFDDHMTVIFVLIPLVDLAYVLMYLTRDRDAALLALKIIYLGGCFLPWMITMCEASLCHIRVSRPVRILSWFLSAVMYGFVLTIGYSRIFYTSFSVETLGSMVVMEKGYGPMHTVHYIVILLYLLVDLGLILYSYRERKQVSRRILALLFIPIPVTMLGYGLNRVTIGRGYEIVPLAYVLAQLVYLFIVQRMVVYNLSDIVVESLVESGDTGFITVDFKKRYLGSNGTAREILPDLNELTVDGPIGRTEMLRSTLAEWIDRFQDDPDGVRNLCFHCGEANTEGERIYSVTVDHLSDGRRRLGYQVFLADDTQNQRYIRLLDQYNADLQKDVAAKTERIVAMHDRLVLGMATMVESRDNSTGGHIRRTSEGVRLLVEEMRKDETLALSEDFCRNIIKAAPMHDLGKIAVDDAILRKNGPFTPEEREEMKKHAAQGARIVHEILRDTDDEEFRRIAENVAHYHHEKVDGTGYPDGLKGDDIPFEARIMAVADVYDALVSKRVYKEKFSFAKADAIIREGMGTQFDERLRPYYEKARPRLEAFYSAEP